jgi:Cupin domain
LPSSEDAVMQHDVEVHVEHGIIRPGGSTGWHAHDGPVVITVVAGTLTFYQGDDPTCRGTIYGPGAGLWDPGFGTVHIARNETLVPAEFYATYILPVGDSHSGLRIPRPDFSNPACRF